MFVGDEIIHVSGETRSVKSIEILPPEPAFHLHVDGNQNFVVDGVIAHNFTTLRILRTWYHKWVLEKLPSILFGIRETKQLKKAQ